LQLAVRRPPTLALLFLYCLLRSPFACAAEWKLVWADEFNTPGTPDPRNWTFENGFVRNHELQWYQSANARCENGLLIIEARRETAPNPNYHAGSKDWTTSREYAPYTSASLNTKGLHQWLYGRFEMRARIDTRPGMWPAFWTLGAAGEWPHGGEIDIMEYYRGLLLANAAWAAGNDWKPAWSTVKKPITEFQDPDWSKKFHVWRMDWDRDFIKLYVDDMLMNSVDLSKTINNDGTGVNPFHQPQYIMLNLAIGGDAGGDPSATAFPGVYEIDWVRVYQQQP
jgi:beta-glucanase (GH16 family)